eukprot:1159145-Pelagomonas_calceolata.AAC.23
MVERARTHPPPHTHTYTHTYHPHLSHAYTCARAHACTAVVHGIFGAEPGCCSSARCARVLSPAHGPAKSEFNQHRYTGHGHASGAARVQGRSAPEPGSLPCGSRGRARSRLGMCFRQHRLRIATPSVVVFSRGLPLMSTAHMVIPDPGKQASRMLFCAASPKGIRAGRYAQKCFSTGEPVLSSSHATSCY